METIKENFRGKGRGLQRKGKLSDLLNQTSILDWVEDSSCDTGGGCFL